MDKAPNKQKMELLGPSRAKRRYLPPLLRYSIIAVWGSLLGMFIFYSLKKLGY